MWYCWKHKPSPRVHIEEVWAALEGAGLAFIINDKKPLKERTTIEIGEGKEDGEGIFPLTYLRGKNTITLIFMYVLLSFFFILITDYLFLHSHLHECNFLTLK